MERPIFDLDRFDIGMPYLPLTELEVEAAKRASEDEKRKFIEDDPAHRDDTSFHTSVVYK